MLIDVHCHAWPDAIADRALAGRVPQLRRFGDGKISRLRTVMARSGLDQVVVLGIADSARHVEGANRFVGEQLAAGLLGFGTVHPDLPVDDNLASLRRHGITGVKLHSLFQGFSLDDRRVWALLEAFGSEIAVIAHVGAGSSDAANSRATPRMIRDIAATFPGLRIVACHFGGYHRLDDAEAELIGTNVYLETSWPPTMATLAPARIRSLIRRHGADRVVFGSDWPMADPAAEMQAVRRLGLSDDETAGILGGNFLRLLGRQVRPAAAAQAASAQAATER